MRTVAVGLIGVCAVVVGTAACAQGENLLANPGFETWADAVPQGWKAEIGEVAPADDARSGARAVRLAAVPNGPYFSAMFHTADTIVVKPDTMYLASVWAKGAGEIRITLQQYGASGYMQARSSLHTALTGEWTLYQFYYGNTDDVRSVRFDLNLRGRDCVVVLDDVSLRELGPTAEPGESLVPNGDMETDADGDGVPDGWSVTRPLREADRPLAIGPDGSRALMCRCSPDPPRPPDLSSWYDWAKQPPPSAGWINAGGTPTFEVEPGRTYLIRYRTRGRGVRTFHTKWWWLDAAGKSQRWFVIGPRHDGDWEWEQVSMYLTVPSAHTHFARIEFWARSAGGRIWADDVSVRPSRAHTEGWSVQTHDVSLVENPVLPPPESKAVIPPRPHHAAAPAERERTVVTVSDKRIRIRLTSGVDLALRIAEGNLLGITDVRIGDLPLRNPDAPPVAPLIQTESGGHYAACRYLDHDIGRAGQVTLRTILVGTDGHEDRLYWLIEPRVDDIAGTRYTGFAYGFRLRSESEAITAVADRSTWEIGGDPLGVTVVTQNAYSFDNLFTIAPDNLYIGAGGTRFAGGDGIDYQYAPEGALATYYAEPVSYVDHRRAAAGEFLSFRDTTQLPGDREAGTALKCVMYARRGGHDEWTRVHDFVYNRDAARLGIRQDTPLPVIQCWMHWKPLAEHGANILRYLADEVAPQVGALGFKVLAVHSVWGRGGCSLDVIEPGTKFGGTEALKYLCDAAAAQGMIVQAWAPTAHMWQHSPLFEQYPTWWLEGAGGKPPTTYCYPDIRGTRFAGGWHDYAVGQWRKIRRQTGLGSLWLDSYRNFTHGINLADRRVAIEQARGLFRFHAALSQLGYVIYTESTGTFGIVAPGFPIANMDGPHPAAPDPMTRYGLSNYRGHEGNPKHDDVANDVITQGDYYYRSLANKAPAWLVWEVFKNTPERHAKIARANRDYCAVVDLMVRRRTLPKDRGVEWTNPDSADRVLFAYRAFEYRRDGLAAVFDVTAGRGILVTGAAFTTEPMHTYRVTVGH
ncbi:MAG: carbohydrate binding domain-containing protein [Armatimonadetes bacterium]|nr:carbohydrate binding domain-containing protein [Armatimonadota bacterium]